MAMLQPQAKQKHGLPNIVHLQFTKALGREGGEGGGGEEGREKGRERGRMGVMKGAFTCATCCSNHPPPL